MTRFLIIRHGQSRANLEQIFTGHTNTPLSELGQKQAQQTAAYIFRHYKPEAVYASDLDRAFNTAKACADLLGLPVIPEKDLREIYAGEWEGVSFDELNRNGGEPWHTWNTNLGCAVCPAGESVLDLQTRILTVLRRIARENDGKTVVIGTHATPVRALQAHCLALPPERICELSWVPNASVTTVLCENGIFTMECAGYAEHLSDSDAYPSSTLPQMPVNPDTERTAREELEKSSV